MAEKRKFSALAELHRQPPETEAIKASQAAVVADEPETATILQTAEKGRGRPATGKRSNPEWKLYSHFLKRKTQRAAVARLQAEDSDRDLSDVLEELLEKWLKL
jgi:Holliday junction resolvase